MPTDVLTLGVGVAAGLLGALLGIGGGVMIVPLLQLVIGVSFSEAKAVSLVGVLATGSAAAATPATRRLLNVRLAMTLQIFSVLGATGAASILHWMSDRTYEKIFGATAAIVAVVMLQRLDRRNVIADAGVDPGALGGRFHDDDSGGEVVYRVRRLPLAVAISFSAGVLASFIGVGGGMLVVPVLNSWCGVPLRVAAATSVFMIGVTAVPALLAHYAQGSLGDFHLAAVAALGVLAGYWLGSRIAPRVPVRSLKVLMTAILVFVAVKYLFFQ